MSIIAPAPERPATEQMTTAPQTQPLQMSYEEWLVWVGEDIRSEWVNGKVIVLMPPKSVHQSLITFLAKLLGLFIEIYELGQLRVAPFEVKLPQGPAREPDLLFLRTAHLNRLTPERVVGAERADLVVEVVSDDSVHRDRVDKFDEYEEAGVPEYWILDNRPGHQHAHFFQLDEHGRYRAIPVEEDGIYRLQVLPGFWLQVDWLWDEDPDALRAIAAVIGPDKMAEALRRALN
jgi:Uma2 family endonuclease